MSLPWYAHSIESYERKTSHLSMLQHGAYRLMMDHYYKLAAPLPAKLEQVHRICRAVAEDEKAAVSAVLAEFFKLESDGWHNHRADMELAKMAEISQKRSNSARSRHKPDASDSSSAPASDDAFAKAEAPANAPAGADTYHTKHSTIGNSKKTNGVVDGFGKAGNGHVTIKDPKDRLARFQKKIAESLPRDGWLTVAAAADPSSPGHTKALEVCKNQARLLGKGWPTNWPSEIPA